MGLDLVQPSHPRLKIMHIKENVLAAESAAQPLIQQLRLGPRVLDAVTDKYSQLPRCIGLLLLNVAGCGIHRGWTPPDQNFRKSYNFAHDGTRPEFTILTQPEDQAGWPAKPGVISTCR